MSVNEMPTDVGVKGGIEDALLGDLSHDHQPLDLALPQQVLELSLIEDQVAGLDHEGRSSEERIGSTSEESAPAIAHSP